MRKFRLIAAAAIAYVLGFPMAQEAAANEVTDIVGAAVSLTGAIVSLAGDS